MEFLVILFLYLIGMVPSFYMLMEGYTPSRLKHFKGALTIWRMESFDIQLVVAVLTILWPIYFLVLLLLNVIAITTEYFRD